MYSVTQGPLKRRHLTLRVLEHVNHGDYDTLDVHHLPGDRSRVEVDVVVQEEEFVLGVNKYTLFLVNRYPSTEIEKQKRSRK